MSEVIHILKKWEKKFGYLTLSREGLKIFEPVKNKRFDLKIDNEMVLYRKFDKYNRIYVSTGPLKGFDVGIKLRIGKDSEGNYYVFREKLN